MRDGEDKWNKDEEPVIVCDLDQLLENGDMLGDKQTFVSKSRKYIL
jgi:hypothetical protein